MGQRNRGQGGGQKGDKKKEQKVVVRRTGKYDEATRKANKKMHLLSEAHRAEKKLADLLERGRDGKPGGILPVNIRADQLYDHIQRLKTQAFNIR